MKIKTKQMLENVLTLPPVEKANLIDRLLSSLDQPDEHIDALWRKEVEDRINAYKAGQIKSVSLEEVMSKYRK
ncbi:addiction module protein [Thermodesulfovibrionales bacterium]|nr:addiction module protein [Thermodesulfovibrionales bacterium]MCL0072346.1 addiction module protein [Thermodesulfovibrionales bacterium]